MSDAAPPLFLVRDPSVAPIPLIVSIPHTGVALTEEVERSLASPYMRTLPITDWHLHHLYDFLPALGATTLYATYSRFVVDLNRAPDARALYPGRFETGLVPTETFTGEAIFSVPPDPAAVAERRRQFHAPYHARLLALLEGARARFGQVCLIDAHSVASGPNRLHAALTREIYLGNRDGASCEPWLLELTERAFAARGLAVSRNDPYKGGYITEHYGNIEGVQALQIEMVQRLYMNEADPAGALAEPRFAEARALLKAVFAELAQALAVQWAR